jgi:pimeloyl-ACP methyl ester carboxylesterase
MRDALEGDRDAFFDDFTTQFFSVDDDLTVSEEQREDALAMCKQSDQEAALGCMDAWAKTDFRKDLEKISVPTLVIHGDSDATVPFEGSGKRTHEAIEGSELVILEGAPHGCNLSHAEKFNSALIGFLSS